MKSAARLRYTGAVLWVLFTVSLASWWMYFELEQARQLSAIAGSDAAPLQRVQRMLRWEGGTFIVVLIGGGLALIVSLRREQARQHEVRAFFMAFTHDLKTALASLQLQVESLEEDLPAAAGNPNLIRLKQDARRLQLQLENSLFLAQPSGGLFIEPVDVGELVEHAALDWPELTVTLHGNARARADRRALQAVVRNVFQNAVRHGAATQVAVTVGPRRHGRVVVSLRDNGHGMSAETAGQLTRRFARPTASSGSGVGLYVSLALITRMRGTLQFSATPGGGFVADLDLPAAGD